MKKSRLLGAVCAGIFIFLSMPASAALIDRGDGLIYDDVLNITWLQDANLMASNTFGLPIRESLGTHPSDSSGVDGYIHGGGSSSPNPNWPAALHWIDAMNADGGTGYKGYDDWRLPTVSPINGTSFNFTLTSDATSDEGNAPTTTDGSDGGWRDSSGTPVSEMGHMFYVNLAGLGFCDPSVPWCTEQTGYGLSTTSFVDGETGQTVPFYNIPASWTWAGTEYNSSTAWIFHWTIGNSQITTKNNASGAWAVRSGDVSAVPIPPAIVLFGSGLLGLIGIARKKAS